ncbi:MAG TPA: hypothetical protein VMN76_09815 [Acidobacteriota bacterium]|nr:hypothetical protein [Acidobacteriota bacterium]
MGEIEMSGPAPKGLDATARRRPQSRSPQSFPPNRKTLPSPSEKKPLSPSGHPKKTTAPSGHPHPGTHPGTAHPSIKKSTASFRRSRSKCGLTKYDTDPNLKDVKVWVIGIQVIAPLKPQPPSIINPMVDAPAEVNQMGDATSKNERIASSCKGNCLFLPMKLIQDAWREDPDPLPVEGEQIAQGRSEPETPMDEAFGACAQMDDAFAEAVPGNERAGSRKDKARRLLMWGSALSQGRRQKHQKERHSVKHCDSHASLREFA